MVVKMTVISIRDTSMTSWRAIMVVWIIATVVTVVTAIQFKTSFVSCLNAYPQVLLKISNLLLNISSQPFNSPAIIKIRSTMEIEITTIFRVIGVIQVVLVMSSPWELQRLSCSYFWSLRNFLRASTFRFGFRLWLSFRFIHIFE